MKPDYEQLSFAALTMLLNATSRTHNQTTVPTWSGPDPSVVQAQATLFASLASALLAAFIATLGKQWLNLYVEGSFIDRNRHRELRMRGMITWKFKFVMECLPLIMQGSLLLLGYGLVRYFWNLSRTVSSVIIAFVAIGFAFYIFIVSAATFSKACPFQTPISIMLRHTFAYCWGGIKRLRRGFITGQSQSPSTPLPSNDEQESEVRADSHCITTMFRMTNTSESITAIMDYIPEIDWDKRIKSIPLLQVYQALRDSLWLSPEGKTLPQPGARERALGSAKALLHLYIQRRCIYGDDEALKNQVQLIDHLNKPLGHSDAGGDRDPDLESTFYVVDWTFGLNPEIPWSDLKLSKSHHCWLGHILQYRAWHSLQTDGRLSNDVRGFLDYSLACPTLPDPVVADCLFIINMVAGCLPVSEELVVKDRRSGLPTALSIYDIADGQRSRLIVPLINDIFDTLETTFRQNTPSGNITPAEEALSLVVLLLHKQIRIRSYALFRIIMGFVKGDDRLWKSARFAMKGAYSSKEWVPPTGNLEVILDFLHFHISPLQREAVGDEPIYHAFRSIVINPSAEKRRCLAAYNFGSPVFIDAMIDFLLKKDNLSLQRMSLLILPELDNLLFTSEVVFNDPERASKFVEAWSSAVGEYLRGTTIPQFEVAIVKALLAIANLPCLRSNLPLKLWDLTYKFPIILYSGSPSMERCIHNSDILPFIKQSVGYVGTLGWLGMLWMKYHSLSNEVCGQLEKETQAIGSGETYFDLDSYISMFDSELKRLQTKIEGLKPLDRAVVELRSDLDKITRTKDRLVGIQVRMQKERQEQQAKKLSPQPKAVPKSPPLRGWLG